MRWYHGAGVIGAFVTTAALFGGLFGYPISPRDQWVFLGLLGIGLVCLRLEVS
jgi:hypothetical protein